MKKLTRGKIFMFIGQNGGKATTKEITDRFKIIPSRNLGLGKLLQNMITGGLITVNADMNYEFTAKGRRRYAQEDKKQEVEEPT